MMAVNWMNMRPIGVEVSTVWWARLQVLFDDLPGNLVGYCYDAIYVGNGNFKPMGLDNAPGYTSIFADTSAHSPAGTHRVCNAPTSYTVGGATYTKAQICAAACPGYTRLGGSGEGTFPKAADGNYGMAWDFGGERGWEADLTIQDAGIIYWSEGTLNTPTPTPTPTLTPTPTPQECFAQPIPAEGVLVRDTRYGPWEFESPNANVKIGIPNDATVVVAYKAIDDATLWYYATSYILNGQEIPIEDSDGLEGDVHGNWILQRNILRLRKDEDMTQPYQGLLLDDSEACRSLPWYGEAPDCYGGTLNMDDTCSFTYNRDMAAAYAIVYAASPNPDATPDASPGDETSTLFCTYNYGGVHTGCASPNRPIPPATPEPNVTHPTDCANSPRLRCGMAGYP